MDGQESAAELYHLGAADGGLQPLPMMKGHVPVVNGRVVAAEGDLEIVVLLELNDGAFHFDIEAWGRGFPGPGVGSGGEAQFREEADLWRKCGIDLQHKLPFVKAAVAPGLIRSRKIEIAESRNVHRRPHHRWHTRMVGEELRRGCHLIGRGRGLGRRRRGWRRLDRRGAGLRHRSRGIRPAFQFRHALFQLLHACQQGSYQFGLVGRVARLRLNHVRRQPQPKPDESQRISHEKLHCRCRRQCKGRVR